MNGQGYGTLLVIFCLRLFLGGGNVNAQQFVTKTNKDVICLALQAICDGGITHFPIDPNSNT
jgi:hypothetical protein